MKILVPQQGNKKRDIKKAMEDEEKSQKKNENAIKITMEELMNSTHDAPMPKPNGESKKKILANNLARTVVVETDMDADVRINLVSLLRENANVFAFSADEML